MSGSRFEDFVSLAITNEIAAAEMYEKYAGIVEASSAKQLLEDMAKMERGHEKKLIEFKDTGVAYFSKIGVIEDLHISDYMEQNELNKKSSIEDVFIFAMKAEQKAYELYSKLGALEMDDVAKNLFKALSDEERKHKHDLEAEYEKGFMAEN